MQKLRATRSDVYGRGGREAAEAQRRLPTGVLNFLQRQAAAVAVSTSRAGSIIRKEHQPRLVGKAERHEAHIRSRAAHISGGGGDCCGGGEEGGRGGVGAGGGRDRGRGVDADDAGHGIDDGLFVELDGLSDDL